MEKDNMEAEGPGPSPSVPAPVPSEADMPKRGMRPYGLAQGEFVVPDDFDDPLPEEILRDFEGR